VHARALAVPQSALPEPVVVEAAVLHTEAPEPITAAPAAAAAPGAAPVADVASAAAVAPAGMTALRRGLPRVASGEPWPPAGTVAPTFASIVTTPTVEARPAEAEAAPILELAAGVAMLEAAVPVVSVAEAPAPAPVPTRARQRTALQVPKPSSGASEPAALKAAALKTAAPKAGTVKTVALGGRLRKALLIGMGLFFGIAILILAARGFAALPFMRDFLETYRGETHLPEGAPVGLPAWLGWQHFFNVFLIVLIIRSGWQVRTEKKPGAYWTPKRPGNGRGKISLSLWLHQSLDVLWLVNGAVFIVLLFATGQWMRVVPTSWDVIPNAVSAALHYATLDWPTENGWVNYNSLQVLAYFTTIFLAAPLAAISGFRMSSFWPKKSTTLSRIYPLEWARAIHFPVMLYFVFFIIVHVTLVFATGALRNLNHMYAAQDVENWAGFWIFFASLVVMVGAWFVARPLILAPIANLSGTVSAR